MAGGPLFRHSGFFVVRMPLLPLDDLVRWADGALAPAAATDEAALEGAVAADRERLVGRLRSAVATPAVREALFVASPSLDEAVTTWMSEGAANVTTILARYFARLTARSTPFGLFAASAVGSVVPGGGLRCAPDAPLYRHTRLDMEYVCALADALERRPETRARLRFAPSTSLYERAGQLRTIEARIDPVSRERRNDLVAIEATDAVRQVLAAAAAGATAEALARGLAATRPGVSAEQAAGFVDGLIDSHLLVSELAPSVTGPSPLDQMVATLERGQDATAVPLRAVSDAIRDLDAAPLGLPADRYRAIAGALAALPAPVELRRLFHVDLYRRDAQAALAEEVVAEIGRAVEALASIDGTGTLPALSTFVERFTERYERRAIPLVEALDEDLGVGFPVSERLSSDPAPLLEGIELGKAEPAGDDTFTSADAWKLRRLLELAGQPSWALSEQDLGAMARPARPLPGAFAVMATVAGASPEAVERGEYTVLLRGAHGPSGAKLFGRFCHGDPALRAQVEAHLRAEEARRPDAVFAEIVHLPQGRLGNILCRPVMRAHEIPYLARPAVDPEHTIPIGDLLVSVERGRVVLRSRRLGREIIPRLTSAHAVGLRDLPIYRFLALLQSQDGEPVVDWSWGPLATAPRLPRVTLGRAVLCPARWTVTAAELGDLLRGRGAARFRAAWALREARALPRWIAVGDGDQRLAVDLDNVLAVDLLADLARDRARLAIHELYPPPEASCVAGRDGRYAHEIVVPFVRSDAGAPATARSEEPAGVRIFAPGSEWLTVKCYAGPSSIDRILTEVVAPLLPEHAEIDRWFFLRYGDPGWHVRLRFQGARSALLGGFLPLLHDGLAPLVATGLVARVQLDTYQREVERYGGPQAMPIAEELFLHDSVAALSIVSMLEGDEGADARWRLALRGTHDLMVDFGLDLQQRLDLVSWLRTSFGAEHGVDLPVERQLGQRFRAERQEIARLLAAAPDGDHPLAPGLEVLAARSAALAPVVSRFADVERRGLLTAPRREVLAAFLHMHANRLLLAQHRAQELVLHDFLTRHYTSELARTRRK